MIWISVLEGLFIAMVIAATIIAIVHDVRHRRK